MPKENKTAYVILGLLNHTDMSGYDIKKTIDQSLRFFWEAGFGQIYPALKQLEKEGHVSKRVEAGENRPNKIMYSITDTGREELKKWLETPAEKEYVKYEILLKLFFGNIVGVNENLRKISDFRKRNIKNLDIMKQFEEQLRNILSDNQDHIYFLLTVLLGKKVYEAYLEWADEAVELLKKSEKPI